MAIIALLVCDARVGVVDNSYEPKNNRYGWFYFGIVVTHNSTPKSYTKPLTSNRVTL